MCQEGNLRERFSWISYLATLLACSHVPRERRRKIEKKKWVQKKKGRKKEREEENSIEEK